MARQPIPDRPSCSAGSRRLISAGFVKEVKAKASDPLGKPPATAVSPGDVGTPLFSCPARVLAGVHVETFLRLLIPARRRAELFERRNV